MSEAKPFAVRAALVAALLISVVALNARDYTQFPMAFIGYVMQYATTREAFISAVFSQFRNLDKNGDGLVVAELAQMEMIERAQQRASYLSMIYAFDLNGDGRIERAEVERANAHPPGPDGGIREFHVFVQSSVGEVMKADRNRDGAIDFEEARNHISGQPGYTTRGGRELLVLDPNKDGRLTARELETLARNAFAIADIDGDGTLSRSERQQFEDATRAAYITYQNTANRGCGVAKPDPVHRLVVVGPFVETEAVSTVSIAGPERETAVSTLDIEPGAQPLEILVMSSGVRIWQFTGATARVARVTLAASQPVAVTGVPQSKVAFLRAGDCEFPIQSEVQAAEQVSRMLLAAVGRKPDVALMKRAQGTIALPSGQMRPKKKSAMLNPLNRGDAWIMLEGGRRPEVVAIDPKAVVAVDPIEPYVVLPNDAGLYQLLNEGALFYLGNRTFKIVKPIKRYPPGLGGANAATFLLTKGVPLPPGRPGHSCVRSEWGVPVNLPGGPSMCGHP